MATSFTQWSVVRRMGLLLALVDLASACDHGVVERTAHAAAEVGVPSIPAPRADGRLPGGVRPRRYALDLIIDPSQERFSGRVRIAVTIERATRAIVMHGRGFTVRSATLVGANTGKLVAQTSLRMAAGSKGEPEELTLLFEKPVPPGEAELDLDYEAPFSSGLKGLYRVQQGDAWYAFTHFEPNDARRAFPCFDEPGWKTSFDVAITVPKGDGGIIAVANAQQARRVADPTGKQVRFEFEQTPLLPTYLVAFAVGPFQLIEGPRRPVPIRLVTTKGQPAALGRLTLEAAAAHLALLAKYFDRPYPYTKLDLVAVPNFGSGAMENAGLVTFREELVLLDPRHASTAARRAMASVVAHELAHQWFGDLVTMKWWDDLWLNEAFATWMSDKIVDAWRPETEARLQALGVKVQVMAEDTLPSARRIRNPVRSTGEAREAFDAITYAKGRAVLTMVEGWLGETVFRDGLRLYVKRHAWGNATAADLYAALADSSDGRPVAAVMDSFTDQTGFPILNATLDCPPAAMRLEQREYITLDRKRTGQAKLWRVPVCVLQSDAAGKAPPGGSVACDLLEGASGRIELGAKSKAGPCPAAVYANAGEAGYYRVGVGPAELARLTESGTAAFSERERFGIVSNSWAAVWAGDLPASSALAFLGGRRDERSRLVWTQIVDTLRTSDRALVTDAARPAFAKFVRELLGPAAQRLGWSAKPRAPAEGSEPKLLRELLLGALGNLGDDQAVLRQAATFAETWLSRPTGADADRARIALPLAARRGDGRLFDRFDDAFRHAKTPEVRLLALSGLTGFDDAALVTRALGLTLDGTIRAQDLRYVFPPLFARRTTRDVAHAWLEAHFDALVRVAPANQVGRLIRLTSTLCDGARVRAAEAFLAPRVATMEGMQKDLKQAVDEGLRCAALADRQRAETSAWLTETR